MKKIIFPACLTISFAAHSQEITAINCSSTSCCIFVAVALFLIVTLTGTGIYLFIKYRTMKTCNNALKDELSEAKSIIKSLKLSNREANQKIEYYESEIDKLQIFLDDALKNTSTQQQPDDTAEREEATTTGNIVYYANYKPQDSCFGMFSEENDGYSIWKITMESQTSATYELAVNIDPYRYVERWFDIDQIVKCDIPPTGTIIRGENVSPGRLIRNERGKWEVDSLVKIRFICK